MIVKSVTTVRTCKDTMSQGSGTGKQGTCMLSQEQYEEEEVQVGLFLPQKKDYLLIIINLNVRASQTFIWN